MATTMTAAPYDAIADVYGLLTAGRPYEGWLDALCTLARDCGLTGDRLLDVACGTGNSFLPLLARGFQVTGCDESPRMLAHARERSPAGVRLVRCDMRALPELGRFDLVTCLDDALNHLTLAEEVVAALTGMRRNLAAGGCVVLDVLMSGAVALGSDHVLEDDDHLLAWRGSRARLDRPGGLVSVRIDVFTRREESCWERKDWTLTERLYPMSELDRCVRAAGLEVAAVRGQRAGGHLDGELDENRDHKAVLVLKHPGSVAHITS